MGISVNEKYSPFKKVKYIGADVSPTIAHGRDSARGFKPRWYHFLSFPMLFILLMATYDMLKPWWENVMFTDPWASTVFTFSIVLAMFLLWTSTLKEE